jgi:hypothetical protein
MNYSFQKLNFSVPEFTVEQLRGKLYTEFPNLTYYHIADPAVEATLKRLCPLETEHVSYIEITGTLHPHVDVNGTAVINYYINSGFARTGFHATSSNPSLVNGSRVYSFGDCIMHTQFVADDHSAYLLNVSKIHSVLMPTNNTRTAISFGFPQYSYQEVANHLEHLWYPTSDSNRENFSF